MLRASMSPYRENARPPDAEPGRSHLRTGALALLVGLAVAAVAARFPYPEREYAELRVTSERLGPRHAPLAAVATDWTGTEVFAAGDHGEVLVRTGDDDALAHGWQRLTPVVDADLHAIARGDGPMPARRATQRVFAVGARGALLDCANAGCRVLPTDTTEDLHAVAIAGGQGIAVGDHGTILHVVVDGDAWRRARGGDVLKVERVEAGVTAPLRAVTLQCDDDTRCRAKIYGDDGAIVVEGEGLGACDDGRTYSGMHSYCSWTWTTRNADRFDGGRSAVELPVHRVITRGLQRFERTWSVHVRVPAQRELYGVLGSTGMPIRSRIPILAAAPLPGGGIVVGADGELYEVR